MTTDPILIENGRAAYLLDLSPREIDRHIVRGILRTKKIGRCQLLVFASRKPCAEGSRVDYIGLSSGLAGHPKTL